MLHIRRGNQIFFVLFCFVFLYGLSHFSASEDLLTRYLVCATPLTGFQFIFIIIITILLLLLLLCLCKMVGLASNFQSDALMYCRSGSHNDVPNRQKNLRRRDRELKWKPFDL